MPERPSRHISLAVLGLLIVCGAIGLAGCDDTEERIKLTMSAYEGEYATLVYIARENKLFEKHGLDVTLIGHSAGKLAADALLSGESDIATGADFVFVANTFQYDDIKILGAITKTASDIELIARKDHGIAAPSDLRGKTIGVTRKSSGEFFLGRLLAQNNISIDAVEVRDYRPPELIEAIVQGEVDAIQTWSPNTIVARARLDENALSWPGQGGLPTHFVLMAREAWLEANEEAVKRLLHALIEAEEFVANSEAQSKEIVARRFGYDRDYVEQVWPNHAYTVSLPQDILILLESQARWYIESGLTTATAVPNYLNHIHLAPLAEIRPEAVTIIR